jgi:hypothetical protein
VSISIPFIPKEMSPLKTIICLSGWGPWHPAQMVRRRFAFVCTGMCDSDCLAEGDDGNDIEKGMADAGD